MKKCFSQSRRDFIRCAALLSVGVSVGACSSESGAPGKKYFSRRTWLGADRAVFMPVCPDLSGGEAEAPVAPVSLTQFAAIADCAASAGASLILCTRAQVRAIKEVGLNQDLAVICPADALTADHAAMIVAQIGSEDQLADMQIPSQVPVLPYITLEDSLVDAFMAVFGTERMPVVMVDLSLFDFTESSHALSLAMRLVEAGYKLVVRGFDVGVPAEDYGVRALAAHYILNVDGVLAVAGVCESDRIVSVMASELSEGSELTSAQTRLLRQAAEDIIAAREIPCIGCSRCMPCPYGVDIPGVFAAYNKAARTDSLPVDTDAADYANLRRRFLFSYSNALPSLRRADRCVACGGCLSRCPVHINIPEKMGDVANYVDALRAAPKI